MDWEVKVFHPFHEANLRRDAPANIGCDPEPILMLYEQCLALL